MAKHWRRVVAIGVLMGAFGLMPATGVSAEVDSPYIDGAMRKLGRGVANVVTSPGEIVRMVEIVGQRDGYLAAASVGTLQGLWRTLLRAGAGVFEVGTFFAEVPKHFEPVIYPEFVFAHGSWGQQDR